MRALLGLALLLVCPWKAAGELTVVDASGRPLQAVVFDAGGKVLAAGGEGKVNLPAGVDSIRVTALGYRDWTGPVPADSTVVLAASAVPSGVVIPVSGSGGRLAGRIPSTTTMGEDVLASPPEGLAAELNARSPGLYAREYGGGMRVLSISLRGAEAGQTGFMVAGHSLQSPLDGAGPGELDLGIFGGMEVARGGAASSEPGAISGTVNLLPRPPGSAGMLQVWGGTHGAAGTRAALGLPSGSLALSLRRLSGGRGGASASAVLSILAGSWRWGGLAHAGSGETEPPDWSPDAVGWRSRLGLSGWADGELGPLGVSFDCTGETMEYSADFPQEVDDTHRNLSVRAEATAEPAGWLSLGCGGGLEAARSTTLGSRRRLLGHGRAAGAGRLGGLSVAAEAEFTASDGGEAGLGASISASVPLEGTGAEAYASVSRSLRFPTFNDLYWPRDAFAEGNPGLSPERATEAELGITGAWGGLEASACGYAALTEDQIAWLPDAEGVWRPKNVAEVRRLGAELQAALDAGAAGLAASMTAGSSVDLSPGEPTQGCRMPYKPDLVGGGECFLDAGPLRLSAGLSARSLSYRNRTQTDYLPGYVLLNAGVTARLGGGVTLRVEGSNLTDREYEVTDGYPGRGRGAAVSMEWKGEPAR